MILCDNCAHEGLCTYESTLRHFAKEMEVPKGPFAVDIFCTRRMPPSISVKTVNKGASDEFIIKTIWPEGVK